jgi:hypothetical protein
LTHLSLQGIIQQRHITEEPQLGTYLMRAIIRLLRYWPALLSTAAALSALVLLIRVSESPLQIAPFVRIDALSAFFWFATLGGLALVLASEYQSEYRPSWRVAVIAALLLIAYATTLTPVIIGAFLLVALVSTPTTVLRSSEPSMTKRFREGGPSYGRSIERPYVLRLRAAGNRLRRVLRSMPGLLAAGCLSAGYGALALGGALRYDDRGAGGALDAFVFWFVLLAAAIACSRLFDHPATEPRTTQRVPDQEPTNDERRTTNDESRTMDNLRSAISTTDHGPRTTDIFRIAWLYPLARLYSLGPWNAGWSFATVLLGGSVALWWACSSLTRPEARTQAMPSPLSYLALALAGLGLSSSAGIAAGCYAMLAYLVIFAGGANEARRPGNEATQPSPPQPPTPTPHHMLVNRAIPRTPPVFASRVLVGAAHAGGVALLSGAAWLVALFHALANALWSNRVPTIARRALLVATAASVALGVGAPLVVRALIEPVIEQLQGGLTPYGDVNIWPWVGLAASDSAHTQVTTLPSIAVALLMLVLSALVYLVARLRATGAAAGLRNGEAGSASGPVALTGTQGKLVMLMRDLCGEVPWLGALFGSGADGEERRIDGE